ncbi:MAG: choice-of-anchor D domain-containing protein [Acidobacteria bacterium]|nr:choice-of-anchor D domain-containing protein [Acidobacteriota bacterium]
MQMTQRLATALLTLSGLVFGQATPANTANIGIRVTLPDSAADVADGATINMVTGGIGQSAAASVVFTNRGTTTPQINFIQMSGSTDFTLSGVPETPLSVAPQQVFGFQVSYRATNSGRNQARVAVNYTVGTATVTVSLTFQGSAPELTFSVIPPGGNAVNLVDGASVAYPATPLDASANATFVITNRGTTPGVFNSASVTGDSFQSVGVPLGGTAVDPNREIRFVVQFTARALDEATGTVTIETGDRRVTFRLTGSGTGARFSYQTAGGPLLPNAMLTLPDAQVTGDKTTLVVRFQNTGNADGRIAVISATGAAFSLTEVPLLPLVVPPGQTFGFTINFGPPAPGRHLGRLRIGTDDFELSGNGLGATLTYSYVANNVTTTVATAGSVIFTPAAVGATSQLRFVIANTGTAQTTVSSIGLAAPSTQFTLGTLPGLPATLNPNQSVAFDVTFSPNVLGTSNATLRVDNATFTLSGAGNAPPPLPGLRFDGATGAQEALQQPAVGLLLERAYPLPLSGTVTLTFNSDVFSNDPAVQFATGGRTVTYTIPANTTRAIFANNANQVRIQTGSVAGTITLTPSIATTDGGINLTPATPPAANLTVAAGAPRILSVALGAKTANTLTILVSGYATSRNITQIQLNFTPATGETVSTTQVTLPVEGAFLGYYNGQASAGFGSLFTASIPLTLAGDLKTVTQLSDTVQSVSVVVTNRVGNSPSVSLTLR